MSSEDGQYLCPSAPAKVGVKILGIVNADGVVEYLGSDFVATSEFVDAAAEVGDPEQRFRFSAPCIHEGCGQWTDGHCSVPERVREFLDPGDDAALPRCGIRPHCRWFAQDGPAICRICPLVVRSGPAVPEGRQTDNPRVQDWGSTS